MVTCEVGRLFVVIVLFLVFFPRSLSFNPSISDGDNFWLGINLISKICVDLSTW
jgi:hypothetical protein